MEEQGSFPSTPSPAALGPELVTLAEDLDWPRVQVGRWQVSTPAEYRHMAEKATEDELRDAIAQLVHGPVDPDAEGAPS